jgi:Cu(I)-responsive transcriptional regulator
MNIGEASRMSGVTAKMIRHYESIGLIQRPARTPAGYRLYSEADVHTLRFIKRARSLGFSTENARELLDLWRNQRRASSEVKRVATAHIRDLEEKIENLGAMVRTLKHLVGTCHGDSRPDCPILDDLSRP